MFENTVLRRIFGPKRDGVTGEWRKLHNEKLDDLYSLPNIFRVMKSGRMSWAVNVARMGDSRGVYRVLEHPGVDGSIILRRILRKWIVRVWTGSSWLRIGTGGGHP